MTSELVRQAAERLLNESIVNEWETDEDHPNLTDDILIVARFVLAALSREPCVGARDAELALAQSQRDTWSDVANEMMHERNAARGEGERLREHLARAVGAFTSGVYCANCGDPVNDCDCVIGEARAALAAPETGGADSVWMAVLSEAPCVACSHRLDQHTLKPTENWSSECHVGGCACTTARFAFAAEAVPFAARRRIADADGRPHRSPERTKPSRPPGRGGVRINLRMIADVSSPSAP